MWILLLILACKSGADSESGAVDSDCIDADPAGNTCSVPDECEIICTCDDGSEIHASRCEGQCSGFDAMCPTYCAAVGWSGEACFDPL